MAKEKLISYVKKYKYVALVALVEKKVVRWRGEF